MPKPYDKFVPTSPRTTIVPHGLVYDTPCCNDPKNWRGNGAFSALWPLDPAYWQLARSSRPVACAICGRPLACTEYSLDRVPDEVMSDVDKPDAYFKGLAWQHTKEAVSWCMFDPLPVKSQSLTHKEA